jgi:integrase
MKISVRFRLRQKGAGKKKVQPIEAVCSLSEKQPIEGKLKTITKEFKVSTGLSTCLADWDVKNQMPKPAAPGGGMLYNQLQDIKEEISQIAALLPGNYPLTAEGYRTASEDRAKQAEAVEISEKVQNSIFTALQRFIDEKKSFLAENTIKTYKTLQRLLLAYSAQVAPVDFADIDAAFYNRFLKFLYDKGLRDEATYKNVAILKTFLSFATDYNYPVNPVYRKFEVKRKNKHENVVLTAAELERFYNYDFSTRPELGKVRDMFCFAVFTCQRYSDIVAFNKKDLVVVNGVTVWQFETVKTGSKRESVIVPFSGFCAGAVPILEKYNYKIPTMTKQVFNRQLKKAAALAGINSPQKINRYAASKKIVLEKPKYQFISSHTARRSGITLLLEKGVPVALLRKITGHADYKTLLKYDNTGTTAVISSLAALG